MAHVAKLCMSQCISDGELCFGQGVQTAGEYSHVS